MNNPLSNDLYEFIRKHITGISQEAFYDSLVESRKSVEGKQQTITLNSFFSNAMPNNPHYDEFRRSVLNDRKNISALYNTYIQDNSSDIKIISMLIELFNQCLAKNDSRFSRSFCRQHLKPASFTATKGREKDALHLKDLLDKYHKIIIYGEPGIGKSRFIKYFLTKWNINDYCYISYDNSTDLKANLHQIQYMDLFGNAYYGSEYELKEERFSSSLLIIDHMYFFHDLSSELGLLSQFSINILVVTLYPVKAESFYLYELPRLSRNDLLRIFTADSEFSISDSVLLEDLFAITGESALMISLIAKLYKKTRETTSEESPSVPLETILHQLEYPNNHMDEKSVLVFRHKHEYTGYDKTLDMIGHIKSVCKKSLKFVDPAAKDYMKWLCCFGAYPLSLDFVSRLIPDYQESCLETLHGMGLVDITDGMLKISPLISFAVFADQNPKPKQKEFAGIFNNLTYFLRTYEETLSVPYLSNALLALVNTLYKKIPFQHNPGQKTVAEQFENWQELIALIYNYYHQYGDYYAAEKAASSINYPDLISKHSYFDACFFHLGNNMQQEAFVKNIPDEIDSLCNNMSANPHEAASADFTYYMINAMDTCVGLYCNDILHSYGKNAKPSCLRYRSICVLWKILKLATQQLEIKLHLPEEKLKYYSLCHQLMCSFSTSPVDCLQPLQNVKKFKNINYRIRGTAFLLFMQSHYLHWLYDNEEFILPGCGGPAQLFQSLLIPEMEDLQEQIRRCMLIPIHTFRICMFSYIKAGMVRYSLKKEYPDISVAVTADNIKELFNRSFLAKEEIDGVLKNIEKYFS